MIGRTLLIALAIASAPTVALAQSSEDPGPGVGASASITGAWAFETVLYDYGCVMTGELVLRATDDPDVYEGELTTHEACDGVPPYDTEQSSVAVRKGDQLRIESQLVRVLPSPDFYRADNFALTIIDSALMVGELRSADVASVTFRRQDDLIS